jgi:transposase
MQFVTPKNEAQQTLSALHRVRESLVCDRTKTNNQIHAFLLEFGVSLPTGHAAILRLPMILQSSLCRFDLCRCWIGCNHTSSTWTNRSLKSRKI